MKQYYRVVLILMVLSVVGTSLVSIQHADAQSGSRVQSGSRTQGTRPAAKPPFENRLWTYLQQVQYKNWAPALGQNGDFYEGQSPHGAFLKMYLNRQAISNPTQLPHRSIVIKENYGPDKKTLMAITVMYRMEGFDPEHYDWYWVKYNPDGTVAKAPPEKGSLPLAGKVKGCIQCHDNTEGNDFAFFND